MKCDRAQTLLNAYVDGELAGWIRAAVAIHLRRCPECAAEARQLWVLGSRVRAWREAAAPASLERRLRAELGVAAAPRRAPAGVPWSALAPVVASMGAVAVALVPASVRLPESGGADRMPTRSAGIRAPIGGSGPEQHPQPHVAQVPAWDGPSWRPGLASPHAVGGWTAPAGTPAPRNALILPDPSPDRIFLDGHDSKLLGHWLAGNPPTAPTGPLSRLRDDFIGVPDSSRLASAAPGGPVPDPQKAQDEARKAVDTRLFRKVTLALKAGSLEELCEALEKQTGVAFTATRGVRDDKVTVFVKDVPARDLMRAVARVLDLLWARAGEEGAYRYELLQTLRSRLTEEETRNRDLNAALIALDAEMGAMQPLLSLSPDQLRARMQQATGPEKERLKRLAERGGWGGMQVYHRLSPAERAALLQGQEVRFSAEESNPERRLPSEWVRPVLDAYQTPITFSENGVQVGKGDQRAVDAPGGGAPTIGLKVNRSELGQLTLESSLLVRVKVSGDGQVAFGDRTPLATGRSPSASQPENARANAALRRSPAFTRRVAIRPEHTCDAVPEPGWPGAAPHCQSGDVWEAVHRATGMPIVADAYTRLYPRGSVQIDEATLFDALCRLGDTMGARWTKDGDFLLARSTSYFWDKLKEVPNRNLRRWQAHRKERGGLPFDDVLEMAFLDPAQLESEVVQEGIRTCWGLPEWQIVGLGQSQLRSQARFVASLMPNQRQRALGPEGLGLSELSPAQRQDLARLYPAQGGGGLLETPGVTRYRVGYVPAGWFLYSKERDLHPPVVVARTPEETLALARRMDPAAAPDAVRPSQADFVVVLAGSPLEHGKSRSAGWFRHRAP